MTNILVTGGAGFIGSNLVENLIQTGDKVVVVDDLSMGLKRNLPQSDQLTFYQKSITDYSFMEQLLRRQQFDYVYLLAAVASVANSIERPFLTHEINQNANLFILETIRTHHLSLKKLLFASSAAVYGNNSESPKDETMTIDPLTPYAIDKYATERFVLAYGRLYNIPTVAVRFFNVYGPRQNPNSPYSGVLSLISAAIKQKFKFSIFGDGEQTRDFVFIDDVIQAILLLTKRTNTMHDVFNVGTGHKLSLNNIIIAYEKVIQQKINVHHLPGRTGDIKHSVANVAKLQALGYRPSYTAKIALTKYWRSLN
ncbi:epimerase [Loigolactobacillus backii]|uniref:NAD-dependent epimerase/dehydratase family protein n=1 Tax=Loigolactobacillus backii TaxID=375175 RepID=UPI000C1C8C37|nr:NAD-dependent epimerase/dehydratase family protein [Loigolactobacillus backii]PIO82436.1 epimerase [Loigolactobacillus backii]